MHLVTPLAAGVSGAENGTAQIYLRDTSNRAEYWLDFEGVTGSGAPSPDILLDSHGGAVIYVADLCDVVVKTSGGAVLRAFVAGARDDAVEVVSPSFTGNAYVGLGSGQNLPTTVGEVLDRWLLINGAVDWKVAVPGGAGLSIREAIAGNYGLIFSVKAYGAVGDGVADDTNAINAAIAAANTAGGGTVFFSPGSYRTMGNHSVPALVSLLGTGRATQIVLAATATVALFVTGTPPSLDCWQMIVGMSIRASAASSSTVLQMLADSQVACSNLYVDATSLNGTVVKSSGGSLAQLLLNACTFQLSASRRVLDTPSANFRRLLLRDCRFTTPANFTDNTVIDANLLDIQGCVFDSTATTTGTYNYVRSSVTNLNWRISGCRFSDAAGATVTALGLGTYAAGSNVTESDNFFGAAITAYSYVTTAGSKGAQIGLRSRELRSVVISDNGTAPVLPTDQYGIVVLVTSQTSPIVFQAAALPPDGSRGTILVRCMGIPSGTVTAGANFLNPAPVTPGLSHTHLWEYRACIPNAAVRMALIVDGRDQGTA